MLQKLPSDKITRDSSGSVERHTGVGLTAKGGSPWEFCKLPNRKEMHSVLAMYGYVNLLNDGLPVKPDNLLKDRSLLCAQVASLMISNAGLVLTGVSFASLGVCIREGALQTATLSIGVGMMGAGMSFVFWELAKYAFGKRLEAVTKSRDNSTLRRDSVV